MQQEAGDAACGQLAQCGQHRGSFAPDIVVAYPTLEQIAQNVERACEKLPRRPACAGNRGIAAATQARRHRDARRRRTGIARTSSSEPARDAGSDTGVTAAVRRRRAGRPRPTDDCDCAAPGGCALAGVVARGWPARARMPEAGVRSCGLRRRGRVDGCGPDCGVPTAAACLRAVRRMAAYRRVPQRVQRRAHSARASRAPAG